MASLLQDSTSGDGQPASSLTETQASADGLPDIADGDHDLGMLLRVHLIQSQDVAVRGFWSSKLLRHIQSRERVRAQLEKNHRNNKLKTKHMTIEELVDAIHPKQDPHPDSDDDKTHFLRIYALLLLCEQSHEIERFVTKGQSDETLPIKMVVQNREYVISCESQAPDLTQACFKNFQDSAKYYFQTEQRRLLTPYFELDAHDRPMHRDFPDGTVLPWCQLVDGKLAAPSSLMREGGYGFITKVKIHPTSHGFHRVLQKLRLKTELFALKKLHPVVTVIKANGVERHIDKKEAFENELQNLKRFSGLVHPHLVTLLASFTLHNEYYFLFPCAESSLEEYWKDHRPSPKFDISTVRWVSKQIAGITAAIHSIHEPKHTHQTPGERHYGRHGDIKPDNILLFKSVDDDRGILVVSDMGLTSFNRVTSRSNIPGQTIDVAPGYRPPECEVTSGTVSRSFDIWGLGCVFLELITWLLGGWELLDEFQKSRQALHLTGANQNKFFDIREYKMADGEVGNVAQVKEQVIQWFIKLHALPHCTKFIHDVVDIVENEMLIVRSKGKDRSPSGLLHEKFRKMQNRCTDENGRDYAIKPAPEKRKFKKSVTVDE